MASIELKSGVYRFEKNNQIANEDRPNNYQRGNGQSIDATLNINQIKHLLLKYSRDVPGVTHDG
jgi:hypothetical protein